MSSILDSNKRTVNLKWLKVRYFSSVVLFLCGITWVITQYMDTFGPLAVFLCIPFLIAFRMVCYHLFLVGDVNDWKLKQLLEFRHEMQNEKFFIRLAIVSFFATKFVMLTEFPESYEGTRDQILTFMRMHASYSVFLIIVWVFLEKKHLNEFLDKRCYQLAFGQDSYTLKKGGFQNLSREYPDSERIRFMKDDERAKYLDRLTEKAMFYSWPDNDFQVPPENWIGE